MMMIIIMPTDLFTCKGIVDILIENIYLLLIFHIPLPHISRLFC